MLGFAIALMADKPESGKTTVSVVSGTIIAKDEQEARDIALADCVRFFSTGQGYINHKVSLGEIKPDNIMAHPITHERYRIVLQKV